MAVQVLCGPVLRRVAPESVTVFLALRAKARVTLRVYAGENAEAAGTDLKQVGSRDTVRLGTGLHVAAVTTSTTGGTALTPGQTYRYQIFFGAPGGTADVPESAPTLFTSGYLVPEGLPPTKAYPLVGYDLPGKRLPSFTLAPDDPAALRILHACDRLPHAGAGTEGGQADALTFVDERIAAAIGGDGSTRPHLLVLTGNQIHADDVSPTVLAATRQVIGALGVPDDVLPGVSGTEQPATLGPGKRKDLTAKAKFPVPQPNHLLSFAEFAVLHLLAFSPAAWPDTLPAFEQVYPDSGWTALPEAIRAAVTTGVPYDLAAPEQQSVTERFTQWNADTVTLQDFREDLVAVRRALANVPVLTAIGEHEVSAGWNGVRGRVQPMLGTPVGRRVVANALAAQAVFQAWGNTPDRFEGTGAGAVLLGKLAEWLSTTGPSAGAVADAVATAAGVPDPALARPASALTYHHLLARPKWQVLVLDTHTQRGYPKSAGDPPAPVADAALDAVLGQLPAAVADAVTIIVSPTPLFAVPRQEAAEPGGVAQRGVRRWSDAGAALHALLGKLATQGVTAGADHVRRRRLVVLSGGAGHGYAARVRYSADKPYQGTDGATEAVVAHVVSGPARHADTAGTRLHKAGYTDHHLTLPRREHLGWDLDLSQVTPRAGRYVIGATYLDTAGTLGVWQVGDRPQLAVNDGDHRLDARPQWRFTAQFLRSDTSQPGPVLPDERLPVELPGPGEPWQVQSFAAAAANAVTGRDALAAGTEIVGENSLGELGFTVAADGPTTVRATSWWRLPGKETQPLTRFAVALAPGESCYDQDRYDGRSLRPGDRDAAGSGMACYEGTPQLTGRLVRDLRRDLRTLGFLPDENPSDTGPREFDIRTEWAVREFQNYARDSNGAREVDDGESLAAPPPRYVERLRPVTIPAEHLYRTEDGLTGVVNRRVRDLISVWLTNRWRCPVVIEALKETYTGQDHQIVRAADDDKYGNLWTHLQPTLGTGRRVFATDFTGRFPLSGGSRERGIDQPEGTDPSLPKLVLLGQRTKYPKDPNPVTWTGPVTDPAFEQTWRPDTEMLPEKLLPGQPTLATLVALATDPVGKARLSTYKVVRSVVEVEAIGYFDGLNGYDNSFVSMGTVHWTAGTMVEPKDNTNTSPQPDWTVGSGELWGFLALLRHKHPSVFDRYFGRYGLDVALHWGHPYLYDVAGHKYTTRPTFPTDVYPVTLPALVERYDWLHTWHWYYRFLMAVRTEPVIQQLMWPATRQRMWDVLNQRWNYTDVNAANGFGVANRSTGGRPTIADVFTSENATAMILRWHVLSPGGVVGEDKVGSQVAGAVAYARQNVCHMPIGKDKNDHDIPCPEPHDPPAWPGEHGPDFTLPPDQWTDDHEYALVRGILHHGWYHSSSNMKDTITQVTNWPTWQNTAGNAITANNPRGFSLPLADLPETERLLKETRGSFHFDTAELPREGA